MYKWHSSSAIGRGTPLAHDFTKVADGIAASLRAFSVSAGRGAGDDGAKSPNRSARTSEAVKEVSSLAPKPSRGIDARALAAKPFTISYSAPRDASPPRVQPGGGNSGFAPRGAYGGRGGSGAFRGRGGVLGGYLGRGGMARGGRGRGRGRGADRGRARGRGRKLRRRGPASVSEDDDVFRIDQYTREEGYDLHLVEGGDPTFWVSKTSKSDLAAYMPNVPTSKTGVMAMAAFKVAAATDNMTPIYQTGDRHLELMRGRIGTFFESVKARERLEKFQGPERRALKAEAGGFYPKKFGSLSVEEKERLNKQFLAGHYAMPEGAKKGDMVGTTALYARKNGTYLTEDMSRLMEDVRSRITQQPASVPKEAAKPAKGRGVAATAV